MQLVSSCLLILIVLPFFNQKVNKMAAEQGKTFVRSTLAATYDPLYEKDYASVVDYYINVLKDSPNISFVIFSSKKDGQEFIIRAKNWSLQNKSLPYYQLQFASHEDYRLDNGTDPVTKRNCFIYSEPILMKDYEWGVVTIGISKNTYAAITSNFYWSTILSSLFLLLFSLYVFYLSSYRIRNEMKSLKGTATKLAQGQLSARASEQGVGEIGLLGQAINSMSTSLEEKSRRLFQLAQVLQQTNDAFVLFDISSKILFINDAITDLTGFPSDHFRNMNVLAFKQSLALNLSDLDEKLEWLMDGKQNFTSQDSQLVRRDGSLLDIEIRLEVIESSETNEQNLLMVISDISQRKTLEKELHQLAFYDKLTDIPNRRSFIQLLNKAVASARRRKKSFALFFLDLDDFKFVNDSLGHDAGDTMLIEVARRLKTIFRGEDTVSRLGGDEFTVIVTDINQENWLDIRHAADKVIKTLADNPVIINQVSLAIGTSIGIAKYPEDGLDQETLLKNADTAMYTAKKSGKNQYAFFSDDMHGAIRQYLDMENYLKQAVATDQITLVYQPIIRLDNQQLIGVEALARWNHPVRGAIAPVDFIALAEKTELIIKLSDQLLNIAFKQMYEWGKKGFTPYMSINVSARQFEKMSFIDILLAKLDFYDLSPQRVQLEFTESIMLDSNQTTLAKFASLKEAGFQLALDDFGTGYSSLSYIHQLPIDIIKIDRSFIKSMLENNRTNAIILAISKLSESLAIKTIAEGIETIQQAEWLKRHQCDYGQGYLFDRPLSAAMIEEKYLLPTQDIDYPIQN